MDAMNTLLEIYVQPGAKISALAGKHDGRLKIRLQASPIEGKANQALIDFLAKLLQLKKQDINIVRGEKSRIKLVSLPATAQVCNKLKSLGIELND